MSAKFNLKRQGPAPYLVILFFRKGKNKFQYSTGEKIDPKAWDTSKGRARTGRMYPGSKELNYMLDSMDRIATTTYRKWLNDTQGQKVTWDDLKKVLKKSLDQFMKKDIDTQETGFLDFVDSVIGERKRSPKYTSGTIYTYTATRKRLAEFEKDSRKKLTFDSFDLEWSLSFQEWCFSKPRSFSTNYVNRLINQIRMFLNEAHERELHTNISHRSRRFNVSMEKVDHIYLNEDELSELYQKGFSGKLEHARDIFIFACYTGLRFSDLSRLESENFISIDHQDFIQINQKKTGERVTIPIHPYVNELIRKYNGCPPPIRQQYLNLHLKELGARCSWGNELVLVRRSIGGETVEQKVKKSSLVSIHTARRSFATNAYKAGIETGLIMSVTGHRTETIFKQYIRIDDQEKARIISKSDFFRRMRVV